MMALFVGLFAWWAVSKAISAALRYRLAKDNGDYREALKQADRFGSGMGAMAGLGTLGYFSLSKQKRETLQKAIQRANFPR